jgi:hypothetical protein
VTKSRTVVFVISGVFGLLIVLAAAVFIGIRHLGKGIATLDPKPLELIIKKAAIDDLLLTKQPSSAVVPPSEYEPKSLHDPHALANDEKLFDTWQTGMQLAEAVLQRKSGDWISSSADLGFVPSERRVDGWGHSYCVLRRGETVLVISAGPSAPRSPACRDIQIREEELASLPHGRMLESPSGNLIMALDQKQQQP